MNKRENILYVYYTTLQGYLNNVYQKCFCENLFPIFPQLQPMAAPVETSYRLRCRRIFIDNDIHCQSIDSGRQPMLFNGGLDLGFYPQTPAISAVNNEGNIISILSIFPERNQGMSPHSSVRNK
jgi:hypothetical protein